MPHALRATAGILSGLVVWAFAAVAGVAAVLAASASALTVLKLAGAAYLVYLGIRTWVGGEAPLLSGRAAARRSVRDCSRTC
jgi:threonine/homoserine/homoserine lactone efflux protein